MSERKQDKYDKLSSVGSFLSGVAACAAVIVSIVGLILAYPIAKQAVGGHNAPWIAAGVYDVASDRYVKEITAKPGDIVVAHMQLKNTTGGKVKFGIELGTSYGLSVLPDSVALRTAKIDSEEPSIPLGKFEGKALIESLFPEHDGKDGWAEIVYQVKISDDYVPNGVDRLEIYNAVTGYDENDKICSDTEGYYTYIRVVADSNK